MKRMRAMGAAVALAAALGAAWGAAVEPPPAAPDAVRITILHINDAHGRLESYAVKGRSVGGYARLATLAADARAEPGVARVFLLDAGDVVAAGQPLTARTGGRADIAVMNHLGFDAWTPGNHEFYMGVESVEALVRAARFPTLAANLAVKATGEPLGRPFVIEKAGPVRIAFFGLGIVSADHPSAEAVAVADPLVTAADLVPRLREQADVVVALSHRGVVDDHSLAVSVPGIDVIVGGHTHTVLPEGARFKGPEGGEVLIVQTGQRLEALGRVDLVCTRADGRWRVVRAAARLIPIDSDVKVDRAVADLIARLAEEAGLAPAKRKAAPEPAAREPAPEPAASGAPGGTADPP
jgi:2',3'-cyclic-nucleotide 2'-phosphodiesterase (5'-nucleotidase family)